MARIPNSGQGEAGAERRAAATRDPLGAANDWLRGMCGAGR